MRKELKQRGIKKLKVVYSKEQPIKPLPCYEEEVEEPQMHCEGGVCMLVNRPKKRQTPGSTAFVPSVVGLIIASEVVKDLSCYHN